MRFTDKKCRYYDVENNNDNDKNVKRDENKRYSELSNKLEFFVSNVILELYTKSECCLTV